MKKTLWIFGVILLIAIGIYIFNYVTLIQPVMSKINSDNRNEGISIAVHYKYYVLFNTLEYNLKNVPSDKAPMDVFRVFLQTASALKEKKFKNVELSFKGTDKFILLGDYFKQLGNEYGSQNPVFTIRTFPENLYNLNGETVYSKWEGGILGVASKQMNDFNDFNKKWYLDESISEITKSEIQKKEKGELTDEYRKMFLLAMGDIKLLGGAIESYTTDWSKPPAHASIREMSTDPKFVPFYIKKMPVIDPWGNEYLYKVSAEGEYGTYWIGCAGSDGIFNGFDQIGKPELQLGNDIVYSNGEFKLAVQ